MFDTVLESEFVFMNVLDVLKMSGSLPLNELNVRVTGSTLDLRRELATLRANGYIEIAETNELPNPDDIPSVGAVVSLTRAGLRK
jgi:hypothetical protein